MADKLRFQEKLGGILEQAKASNMRLTIEETEQYFEDDHLTKEQMALVYDYLLSQKVVVKGYTPKGGTTKGHEAEAVRLKPDEEAYLSEYQAELAAIAPAAEGEKERLLEQAVKGDSLAKSRLIEIYLPEVVKIAKEMYHEEMFLGDLVQEGNVSLMLALDGISDAAGADEEIQTEIRQGMQALIEEDLDAKTRDKKMVNQVAELDKSITELNESLGRKVSLEELALHMDMTEEEIANILKLTGEEEE